MDRLAPEIISNIISHFYPGGCRDQGRRIAPLAPLAVLCRHWQPLVEAETFRHLRLDGESFHFIAQNRVLTPRRLSYLRKLVYEFPCRHDFPTRFDQWYKNGPAFDLVVKMLFYQLAEIPLGQEPLLDLELIIPPFDEHHHVPSKDYGYQPGPVIKFTLPDLPSLPMVRSLEITNSSFDIDPSPRIFMYMASKMPQLREFTAALSPSELRASLIHQRVELAQSLSELPTSIHNFSLKYHQHHRLPDGLLVMQSGEDILTRELRRFTQREGLKDFTFYGCVEPSIFWPPASDISDPRHWPTLKSLVLNMDRVQELACLRAKEPFSKARNVKNWDRVYAHGGLMNEFYRAAAKCSACMPKTEYNSIDFNDKWSTSLAFCTVFPEDPCLKLNGKPDLEIEDETVDEWRKAAGAHNLVFKVRLGEDGDTEHNARDMFKPEEIVERAGCLLSGPRNPLSFGAA
ncbi:hypothetical protein FLAG1_05043 [Fusarium langsethiae]|uniref:F-box domain-containing protein n=1 Tax=Fusarium langsethiae TaxID=179993 RepID=A0A0N0DF52_FUSLA|nr:hypothetical protein FLAG1_05043 [Fusarium langsethiae]GKU03016.1 unnamed protein product [Fusarium langsethiae]GKU19088.1 unnamed protein product [Fusarium langsethiae]